MEDLKLPRWAIALLILALVGSTAVGITLDASGFIVNTLSGITSFATLVIVGIPIFRYLDRHHRERTFREAFDSHRPIGEELRRWGEMPAMRTTTATATEAIDYIGLLELLARAETSVAGLSETRILQGSIRLRLDPLCRLGMDFLAECANETARARNAARYGFGSELAEQVRAAFMRAQHAFEDIELTCMEIDLGRDLPLARRRRFLAVRYR